MQGEGRTIFIFSMEPWGDMWYSKHHYATHLARHHTVYFVALPDRWRLKDLFSFGVKVTRTKEGVNVVEYRNNLPLRVLPGWLANLVDRLNATKLKRLYPKEPVILWTFYPARLLAMRKSRRRKDQLVYHVVDPFQVLPIDTATARKADLVVAINTWFLAYYRNINRNCILVPHGVRESDRHTNADEVARNQERWGRYVVVAASLNHRTNHDVLQRVAERYPDLRVVLIGQLFPVPPEVEAVRQRLLAMPNVVHLGVLKPDAMRHVIGGACAGLVTYDFHPALSRPTTGTGTPLKVITYLAQRCPVITTINSFIPELDGRAVHKAADEEHFVELVGAAMNGGLSYDADAVENYLDGVEYGRLTTRILEALDEARKPPPVEDGADRLPWNCPVMVVSNEGWDGPRYSKHRYALELCKYRKVFFVDPPKAWSPRNLLRWKVRQRTIPEGITILSYDNVLPLFNGRLGPLNDHIIARRLRRYLDRNGWDRPLFWSFDPNRLTDPGPLRPFLSIYHCVDDHGPSFPGELRLAPKVDHVFCIARGLMQRFRPLNPSVHHVPHGIAQQDIAPFPDPATPLPAPPGYGLYIGNINDRHDFALWHKLMTAHPDTQWVVVGIADTADPIAKDLLGGRHPNVRYLGPMPYEKLGTLVRHAGFGFLYLRPDHPPNRFSSQKVVQFLAQGKPFFCSWLSEYEDHRDVVYMSDGHDEALEQFARWVREGEPAAVVERRRAYAEGLRFPMILGRLPFRVEQPREEDAPFPVTAEA